MEKNTKLAPHATKCIFLSYGTDGEFSNKEWDSKNQILIWSSDVVFNEGSILSQNQQKILGKKVSFKIATDGLEGPTHRTELPLRQRAIENEVPADPDTEEDPLGELEDKAIKYKDESPHVEKGKAAKTRVRNDRVKTNKVNPTATLKVKRPSRSDSTKTIDPTYGEDNQTSPNSYIRGKASDKTPDKGSNKTDTPDRDDQRTRT